MGYTTEMAIAKPSMLMNTNQFLLINAIFATFDSGDFPAKIEVPIIAYC